MWLMWLMAALLAITFCCYKICSCHWSGVCCYLCCCRCADEDGEGGGRMQSSSSIFTAVIGPTDSETVHQHAATNVDRID